MKNYNLRPIWNAALDVYAEIERICKKHGFTIFAGYGTLLGAVRHKGFIPWDDDLDFLMPRNQYEEFFKIANEELPSCYRAVYWKNDARHGLRFGKVIDTREENLDRIRQESNLTLGEGIGVDIYPIDGIPENKFVYGIWRVLSAITKATHYSCSCLRGTERISIKLRWLLGMVVRKCIFPLASPRYLRLINEKVESCWDCSKSPMLGDLSATAGSRSWRIKRSAYESVIIMPFEHVNINAPVGYDEILTGWYRDYMRLPPEDKRVPSHQVAR